MYEAFAYKNLIIKLQLLIDNIFFESID